MKIKALSKEFQAQFPPTMCMYDVYATLEKEHGFVWDIVNGRIGQTGSKVHRLRVLWKKDGDSMIVAAINTLCGSAKFTVNGASSIYITNDECVTCGKC